MAEECSGHRLRRASVDGPALKVITNAEAGLKEHRGFGHYRDAWHDFEENTEGRLPRKPLDSDRYARAESE